MAFISLLAFLISFVASYCILLLFKKYKYFLSDTLDGPQKMHESPVPRVGGIGIFVPFIVIIPLILVDDTNEFAIKFLISALPVFIAGLVEDITKKVSPKQRLLAAALSGIIFIYFTNIYLKNFDIHFLDVLMQYKLFAMVVTVFCIAGVANSINLIDGFNGLASGSSMLIFMAFIVIGLQRNDILIVNLSLMYIFAILGFFVFNFPFGKIFLGDAGAYFLGFGIATVSITLLIRNPEINPWCPLLIAIYPVYETIFSMIRRKVFKRDSMGKPDSEHFHQLVYKVIIPKIIRTDNKLVRNSATSPFLWVLCCLGVVPGVIFWDNKPMLVTCVVLFCIFYTCCYVWLVRKCKTLEAQGG
jgi:UDP-N-acetylmuramyl pentapeptide phosphotransferase/UDP-N-acetylglucosamine-1-phosphate transferase